MTLWRRRIDPPEVVEHELTLVGAQAAELIPRRLVKARSGPTVHGCRAGDEPRAVDGRLGFTLARAVTLVLFQRVARVEQSVIETLLPGQRGRIRTRPRQCAGDLV